MMGKLPLPLLFLCLVACDRVQGDSAGIAVDEFDANFETPPQVPESILWPAHDKKNGPGNVRPLEQQVPQQTGAMVEAQQLPQQAAATTPAPELLGEGATAQPEAGVATEPAPSPETATGVSGQAVEAPVALSDPAAPAGQAPALGQHSQQAPEAGMVATGPTIAAGAQGYAAAVPPEAMQQGQEQQGQDSPEALAEVVEMLSQKGLLGASTAGESGQGLGQRGGWQHERQQGQELAGAFGVEQQAVAPLPPGSGDGSVHGQAAGATMDLGEEEDPYLVEDDGSEGNKGSDGKSARNNQEGGDWYEEYNMEEDGEAGDDSEGATTGAGAEGQGWGSATGQQQGLKEAEPRQGQAELDAAEDLVFFVEEQRDVAQGVAQLASMYERMVALLPPTESRRQVNGTLSDNKDWWDLYFSSSDNPETALMSLDLSVRHPEVTPYSQGSYTLASLLTAGLITPAPAPAPALPAVEGGPGAGEGRGVAASATEAAPGAWAELGSYPSADAQAVAILHRAAMAGSAEAALALADRYLEGRGVPKNVREGLKHAKEGALLLLKEVEEKAGMSPHPAPLMLRRQWMEGGYTPEGSEEHSHHMISLEQDLADRGQVEGHRQMGYRLLLGHGVPRDEAGAFRQFQEAGRQGDGVALFNIAYMYMRGVHVAPNMTKALHYLEQAAEQELPAAYNGLGVMYFHGQAVEVNYTLAREYFEKGAELNDQDAIFNLGTMYQGGYGIEPNQTKAVALFDRATERGSWRAPYQLLLVFEGGWAEVAPNTTRAVEGYRKFLAHLPHWGTLMEEASKVAEEGDLWGAAVRYALIGEQGCPAALLNLGWLLLRGAPDEGLASAAAAPAPGQRPGVPRNPTLALSMFQRAAALGEGEGMVLAGHLLYEGERYGLEGGSDPAAAVEFYKQAAEEGNSEGLHSLAFMHQYGLGVPRNLTFARQLYQKAVDKAGTEAHALAPWLALLWLQLQLATGCVVADIGTLRTLWHAAAGAAGALSRPAALLSRAAAAATAGRLGGVAVLLRAAAGAAGGWDALTVALLTCALTWVVWRKRQVRLRQQGQQGVAAGSFSAALPETPHRWQDVADPGTLPPGTAQQQEQASSQQAAAEEPRQVSPSEGGGAELAQGTARAEQGEGGEEREEGTEGESGSRRKGAAGRVQEEEEEEGSEEEVPLRARFGQRRQEQSM